MPTTKRGAEVARFPLYCSREISLARRVALDSRQHLSRGAHERQWRSRRSRGLGLTRRHESRRRTETPRRGRPPGSRSAHRRGGVCCVNAPCPCCSVVSRDFRYLRCLQPQVGCVDQLARNVGMPFERAISGRQKRAGGPPRGEGATPVASPDNRRLVINPR